MCGYCHAMTAGEAEDFYAKLNTGTATGTSAYVHGHVAPRSDLQQRQKDELAAGAFEDAPKFRKALLRLVGQRFADASDFERRLVALREAHKRPVLTDKQVDNLFARRDELRAEAGLSPVPAANGGPKKSLLRRVLDRV